MTLAGGVSQAPFLPSRAIGPRALDELAAAAAATLSSDPAGCCAQYEPHREGISVDQRQLLHLSRFPGGFGARGARRPGTVVGTQGVKAGS
jgi:hypothetical protein